MELRSYLPVLRAHVLAILVFMLLGGAAAYGWTLLQPKVYSANSSGYVAAGSNTDTGNALVGDNLAQSKVKSYIDIGSSRAVAQFAIDDLGLTGVSPETLVRRITVSNPSNTVLMKVSATGPTPVEARDLAEAWLRGIAQQIQQLENPAADPDAGTGIVTLVPLDSAVLPTSPTSPNTRLAVIMGLVAGLLVGLVYAFARHALDRRIRTAESVELETGLSVIGSIPIHRRFTDETRLVSMEGATDYSDQSDDDVAVAEAMREVRTNLQFMDVDNPPRVIVVTSPLPGDGKSTTIANLAIALAAGGQAVVLVDADLRRPTVSKTFNLIDGAGLTDVLAGRSDIGDVLQPWGNSGRLAVLAAGKLPPNPSELLGSARMHTLLADLSKSAIVLIDAPPLLPVTDAAVLTHNTDGALIVASAGKTTYEGLNKALQNLKRANGRPLGIILNRMPRRGAYGYGYGYGYAPRSSDADAIAEAPAAIIHSPQTAESVRRDSSVTTPSSFDEVVTGGGFAYGEVDSDGPELEGGSVGQSKTRALTRRELRNRAKN